MATYYLRVDGNDSNAGTADTSGGAWRTLEKAGTVVTAGDTVYIRGSAGNASSYPTSSPDYTIAAYFTPGAGSASGGHVKWIGLGTMPTISSPGLGIYGCVYNWFEGLYFYAASATNALYGIISALDRTVIKGCIFNAANQAGMVCVALGIPGGTTSFGGEISGSECYGGTTSPSSSSGAYGIQLAGYGVKAHGNKIRYCRDIGIVTTGSSNLIRDNLIYGCVGSGIDFTNSGGYIDDIVGNTINGNGGHGIMVNGTNGAASVVIRNNCITNQTGGSKYGINVATSSSDKRKVNWGYNNLYNNTSNYNNVTADSTDISIDPTYADAANGDFTPSNTSLKVAFPTSF